MPITLTISEDLLPAASAEQVMADLSDALLEVDHLTGNTFMTPNIVSVLQLLPSGRLFAAGRPAKGALVELKLPAIALASGEAKQAYIDKATGAVERACEGRLRRDQIWVNVVYAADGAWGIAGQSFSNAALIAAVQAHGG